MRQALSAFFLFFTTLSFSQKHDLTVLVIDSISDEKLAGAVIYQKEDKRTVFITNSLGKAQIQTDSAEIFVVQYMGYKKKKINISKASGEKELVIKLISQSEFLQTTTVTANRYEQNISESTVSLDVVDRQLLERNNSTSVDEGLQRVPGLDIIDGQPNIRGGSGYSYGAGSRVLVLLDDIPILQADAGFPQWDDLPVELIKQVEIVKGAASALYGSSALNGIINLRTDYATSEAETKIAFFGTLYGSPVRKSHIWWNDKPYNAGAQVSHKQSVGKSDFVFGLFNKTERGFNRGFEQDYSRFSGSYRYKATKRLNFGLNYNFNNGRNQEFFYWKSLDSAFVGAANTLSTVKSTRFNVDPRISYYSKNGGRHRWLSRYHFVDNETNNNRSNASQLLYNEYQYTQKNFLVDGLSLSTGVVHTSNSVEAELYGDTSFSAQNTALYLQGNFKLSHRLGISAGARWEHNRLQGPELFNCRTDFVTGEQICDTLPGGSKSGDRPVFRFGGNYHLSESTFLRASWGQGYRYPTVAEQFINTNFGAVPVSPNPELNAETGWSTELGIKQVLLSNGYSAFFDVSVFWSRYQNMMEFNFVDLFPTGFRSVNVGDTDIKGAEISWTGEWKINDKSSIVHLLGYNYLLPRFQDFDTSSQAYVNPQTEGQKNAANSSSKENILKYRFQHTIKGDIEYQYGKFSLGTAYNFYSPMKAVDAVFEGFIVPGLKEFREEQSPMHIINLRGGLKLGPLSVQLLCNNVLNVAYSLRPGLMEAPRNYAFRFSFDF